MTLVESLFPKRNLMVFIGEENHSSKFKPNLFSRIWNIPETLPSKELLIVPVKGLGEPYKLSKEMVLCLNRKFWVLFVESSFLTRDVILFDTFPQNDENSYFTKENVQFLRKYNCHSLTVCDIGVYKSRSLMNLLHTALMELSSLNISICLATILGYNSRGYTDVENADEHITYKKEFYLNSEIGQNVKDDFHFIQIDGKFRILELFQICSFTKNPADTVLQHIKKEAEGYKNTLKPLLDAGFFEKFIKTLDKGNSFDFELLNTNLSKCGFKGDLIDKQWSHKYERLCQNIKSTNNKQSAIQELILEISNNINNTIYFLEKI